MSVLIVLDPISNTVFVRVIAALCDMHIITERWMLTADGCKLPTRDAARLLQYCRSGDAAAAVVSFHRISCGPAVAVLCLLMLDMSQITWANVRAVESAREDPPFRFVVPPVIISHSPCVKNNQVRAGKCILGSPDMPTYAIR